MASPVSPRDNSSDSSQQGRTQTEEAEEQFTLKVYFGKREITKVLDQQDTDHFLTLLREKSTCQQGKTRIDIAEHIPRQQVAQDLAKKDTKGRRRRVVAEDDY